jgi:DNA polymerase-1
MANDQAMIELFKSGEDFHMGVAKAISKSAWGIEPSAVNDGHRKISKRFSFGLIYGMTDSTLAEALDIQVKQATAIRAAIYGKFKALAALIAKAQRETRQTGSSWTLWDGKRARRRNLEGIKDANPSVAINALNSAFNSPVQGTANEFCTMSAVQVVKLIWEKNIDAKVIATVHDAIVVEMDCNDVHWLVPAIVEIMESQPMPNGCPLKAEIEIGNCLGVMKKAKLVNGVVEI